MKSKQGMTEYYAKIYQDRNVQVLRFSDYRSMELWFYRKVKLQVIKKQVVPVIECFKTTILSTESFDYLIFKF